MKFPWVFDRVSQFSIGFQGLSDFSGASDTLRLRDFLDRRDAGNSMDAVVPRWQIPFPDA